jgi:hypothetical protein
VGLRTGENEPASLERGVGDVCRVRGGESMRFCAVECYAWRKVREVRDEETAFAWREEVDFWA